MLFGNLAELDQKWLTRCCSVFQHQNPVIYSVNLDKVGLVIVCCIFRVSIDIKYYAGLEVPLCIMDEHWKFEIFGDSVVG